MTKYVYDFAEGGRDMKDLLGGKGANLAEMTNLGLPVPPGFVITTEACKTYLDSGDEPAEMRDLLGGKGANLAEMASLGLPVPPGFTITTDVCTYYYANGRSYPEEPRHDEVRL